MKTKVGLTHEPKRKLPWMVYWFGEPDPETGKQSRHAKCFRYNREAREFQTAKQVELNHGSKRDHSEEVTLGRLLDQFWEARVANLGYKSQTGYKATIDGLRRCFGNDRMVAGITIRHAEAFMAGQKRRNGRPEPLSTWTRNQRVTHCRAIFGAAILWGYSVNCNPFKPLPGSGRSPLRVKAKSRPWHHLIPDEFDRMVTVVPSVKRRAAHWLMYGAGLRPGEVYNLTLDRIDLENRRVHVANRASTADVPPFTVKSAERAADSKERTVPIPEAAIPDVAAACKQAFKSGGFVVLSAERFAVVRCNWQLCRDGKPWGGRMEHRPWQNADMLNNLLRDTKGYLRKAGVELTAPFTLTTFRKSFAQNHADAGTPPRTLAKLLGHSKASVTMEFYNRVTDANERAAARTMDRILSKPGDRAVGAS